MHTKHSRGREGEKKEEDYRNKEQKIGEENQNNVLVMSGFFFVILSSTLVSPSFSFSSLFPHSVLSLSLETEGESSCESASFLRCSVLSPDSSTRTSDRLDSSPIRTSGGENLTSPSFSSFCQFFSIFYKTVISHIKLLYCPK